MQYPALSEAMGHVYWKPQANHQTQIQKANIISHYVPKVFVFNNSDVYNSVLNKMNKINQIWNYLLPN